MQYVDNEMDVIFKIIQYCEQSKLLSFEYIDNNISLRFNKDHSQDVSDNKLIIRENNNYSNNNYDSEVALTSILKTDSQEKDQEDSENDEYVIITSPFVGTIEFSNVIKQCSDEIKIKKGDVICSVEAMKIYNDIKSTINGTVVQILVEDGSFVEFEQPIVKIKVDRDE